MSDHLVLPFEALSAHAPGTGLERAVMRSAGGMHVCVRVEEILGLEGRGGTGGKGASEKGGGERAIRCDYQGGAIRHLRGGHAFRACEVL